MTFIEDLFGLSPDGGSGSFELALILVPLMILAGWIVLRRRSRPPRL